MSTDNKTLADVQPGGRVRLGDALPPLPIRQRFTTLHGETYAYSAEQMQDYARAALPAQPSPGGQGDALATLIDQWMARADRHEVSALEADSIGGMQMAVAVHEARAAELNAAAHSLKEALAARQPVGQIDEAAVLRRAASVLYMWEDDPNLTGYMGDFKDACGILELLAQHAAPPAQAVDLGEMPDGWRLSKKTTCYQLSHGKDIIGNLVGPDAEENAAIIARVLDSQAVGK